MTRPSGAQPPGTPESSTPKIIKPIYYSYSLDRVMKIRSDLREVLAFEFQGRVPKGASFTRLLELVQETLPGTIDLQTLEDSLRHAAGTHMTEELLDAVAWRMAGNHLRLKDRRAVPPWHVQKTHEWVPVTVVSCRRQRNSKNNPGAMYGFRIVAGTPAGLLTFHWWSAKYARYLASKLGFSIYRGRNPPRHPFSTLEQLVGLRLDVLLDPALCEGEPGFKDVDVPAAAVEWNKRIIACRLRTVDDFECLMEKSHDELSCHNCPVGFVQCPAATHRHDWVQKACTHCGDAEANFDTDMAGDMCVDCIRKEAQRSTK